ncbi:virulence RhuM family protein [Diaminobutyricibacter sp. McL0608]|uniref:virulence RhuM family protein n=1 Tax=Leifsonia sp. McL0608 TaxID=3143537 RepID=UPI0031F32871
MDEVEIYQSDDGTVRLDVKTDGDTVWLTQAQMGDLFGRERSVIVRHIANAEREELDGIRTRAKFAQVQIEGGRTVERDIEHYSLDVVISVGYRVKSQQGVRFRRWANDVLRRYVVQGVATNEARLREIGAMVQLLERSSDETVAGIAEVLRKYTPGLTLLDECDRGAVPPISGDAPTFQLDYASARQVVDQLARQFPNDRLLDKRSAAALFTWYLEQNKALTDELGRELVNPKMLAAVSLMTAMSRPDEKDSMIRLIGNLIAR